MFHIHFGSNVCDSDSLKLMIWQPVFEREPDGSIRGVKWVQRLEPIEEGALANVTVQNSISDIPKGEWQLEDNVTMYEVKKLLEDKHWWPACNLILLDDEKEVGDEVHIGALRNVAAQRKNDVVLGLVFRSTQYVQFMTIWSSDDKVRALSTRYGGFHQRCCVLPTDSRDVFELSLIHI